MFRRVTALSFYHILHSLFIDSQTKCAVNHNQRITSPAHKTELFESGCK
jgi:hypothetical protein